MFFKDIAGQTLDIFCDTVYSIQFQPFSHLPKLIKIRENFTKFWQKQKCSVFETWCIIVYNIGRVSSSSAVSLILQLGLRLIAFILSYETSYRSFVKTIQCYFTMSSSHNKSETRQTTPLAALFRRAAQHNDERNVPSTKPDSISTFYAPI